MKFKPIGERALVKIEEQEQTTSSGIVLPETAKDKPQTARVVAVGDMENGNGSVGEGDLVVFARFAGTEIKLNEQEYLILDAEDLLGIVDE
jgi:chaperonin GroES